MSACEGDAEAGIKWIWVIGFLRHRKSFIACLDCVLAAVILHIKIKSDEWTWVDLSVDISLIS